MPQNSKLNKRSKLNQRSATSQRRNKAKKLQQKRKVSQPQDIVRSKAGAAFTTLVEQGISSKLPSDQRSRLNVVRSTQVQSGKKGVKARRSRRNKKGTRH